MKPLLIHMHVYYPHLWIELRDVVVQLEKQSCPFHLVVTMVEPHLDIEREVKELWPEAEVRHVPNLGYDIAPFLEVLNGAKLEEYSYILKLHTKRNVDKPRVILCAAASVNMKGSRWRDALLAFTRQGNLERVLQELESDKQLGMVAHHLVICPKVTHKDKEQYQTWLRAVQLVRQLGLQEPPNCHFVMGSMFICRAELLKPLQRLGLKIADFPSPDTEHLEETMAHVVERMLGAVVTAQGYTVRDCFSPLKEYVREAVLACLLQIGHFLFYRKVTRKGKVIVKVCKIPVYYGKANPSQIWD